MQHRKGFTHRSKLGCLMLILIAELLVCTLPLHATPPQGSSTYYSSTCSSSCGSSLSGSGVYIDASQFSGSNLCVQLNNALHAIPSGVTGALVDARGINSGLSCSSDPFNGTHIIANGSVVLLPRLPSASPLDGLCQMQPR